MYKIDGRGKINLVAIPIPLIVEEVPFAKLIIYREEDNCKEEKRPDFPVI